jgi:hypothetical protein
VEIVRRWEFARVKRQRDDNKKRVSIFRHLLRNTRPVNIYLEREVVAPPPPFSFFDGRAVAVRVRDVAVDLYMDGGSLSTTVTMIICVLNGLGHATPARVPNAGHLTLRALVERSLVELRSLALDLAEASHEFGWRWDATTNWAKRSFFAASICYIGHDGDSHQVLSNAPWQCAVTAFRC